MLAIIYLKETNKYQISFNELQITLVGIKILSVKIVIIPDRFKSTKSKYHNEIVPSCTNFFSGGLSLN